MSSSPRRRGSISRRLAVPKQPAVYILASRFNGTPYTGVTGRLVARVWEHRTDAVEGFSKRHGVHRLVWYERHATMIEAIRREKAIEKWPRNWKIGLIQVANPDWVDLWPRLVGEEEAGSPPARG
jgi:putative endonuclease